MSTFLLFYVVDAASLKPLEIKNRLREREEGQERGKEEREKET